MSGSVGVEEFAVGFDAVAVVVAAIDAAEATVAVDAAACAAACVVVVVVDPAVRDSIGLVSVIVEANIVCESDGWVCAMDGCVIG